MTELLNRTVELLDEIKRIEEKEQNDLNDAQIVRLQILQNERVKIKVLEEELKEKQRLLDLRLDKYREILLEVEKNIMYGTPWEVLVIRNLIKRLCEENHSYTPNK